MTKVTLQKIQMLACEVLGFYIYNTTCRQQNQEVWWLGQSLMPFLLRQISGIQFIWLGSKVHWSTENLTINGEWSLTHWLTVGWGYESGSFTEYRTVYKTFVIPLYVKSMLNSAVTLMTVKYSYISASIVGSTLA